MNNFLRTVPVMVAGFLLLGAAEPEGVQPLSPYRHHYDSNTSIHRNFKTFFQQQWKDHARRVQCDKLPEDKREVCLGGLPPLVPLPLSMSWFRAGGNAPVIPKRIASAERAISPEERKALEAALLELLKGYEQSLAQQDQPQLKDNLAGAFNYLFISSFYALKNGQELNVSQQRSMLEQINAAITLGLKARRLSSDREKQELYESVVLSGRIILGLYNEGHQKEARELAEELLEQMMGIDIEKVHLEPTTVWIE